MNKIEKKHEDFLKNDVGISPAKFKSMSFEELDALVDEKIVWMECDGNELASDIIDIIYGLYDGAEIEADLAEYDEDDEEKESA